MSGRCTVCNHGDLPAIDVALVNRKPFRHLSETFGLSTSALVRHSDDHLPEALTKAKGAEDVANADDLLTRVKAWRERTDAILTKAEGANDFRACASLMREIRGWETLLAEVEQRIDRRPTLVLAMAPEWIATRSVLLDALRPYPEARTAVAASLLRLGASS